MIEIEKNIPIPEAVPGANVRGKPCEYPWDKLAVGDSFLVPKRQLHLTGAAILRYKPKRFTQRYMDGGTRIWRIR